jgi:carbon-monoxide dehydrogenase large subunit
MVRVHITGAVTVYSGTSPHGQGHDTGFAQIVADRLGIDPQQIEVMHGDTATGPQGLGTYGSRSLAVGGEAIANATAKVVDKARRIVAHQPRGRARGHRGPRRQVHGPRRARQRHGPRRGRRRGVHPRQPPGGHEPGSRRSAFYDPRTSCSRSARTRASVDVDAETGKVSIVRYIAVDDCGPAVNPTIIDGQIHGGVAQAIARRCTSASTRRGRQLVTGTFVDYALPSASELRLRDRPHRDPVADELARRQGASARPARSAPRPR